MIFPEKMLPILMNLFGPFSDKIELNEEFIDQCIESWSGGLPKRPLRTKNSNDLPALAEIDNLNQELQLLALKNSVKGYAWRTEQVVEFAAKLAELEEKISSSDIDSSVFNLYHAHRSVLLRAQGEHAMALRELNECSRLLQNKIDSHPGFLPGYSREIIFNAGMASELHRLMGHFDLAIEKAGEMQSRLKKFANNTAFQLEDSKSQCPISSWALYFACEAHLAARDQSPPTNDWTFNHSFPVDAYKSWPVPVLFRVLCSSAWRTYYPFHSKQLADFLHWKTANGKAQKIARRMTGRTRLKPQRLLALAAVVGALAFYSAFTKASATQPSPKMKTEIITPHPEKGAKVDPKASRGAEKQPALMTKTLVQEVAIDRGTGVGKALYFAALWSSPEDRGTGVGRLSSLPIYQGDSGEVG